MKTVMKMAAQGDVLFRRVDSVPEGALVTPRTMGEPLVVAHSETGHHHAVDAADVVMFTRNDPMVCYLSVGEPYADVVHHRQWDTHETLRLPKGVWEVRRQREHTPEGWRRVED